MNCILVYCTVAIKSFEGGRGREGQYAYLRKGSSPRIQTLSRDAHTVSFTREREKRNIQSDNKHRWGKN